MIRAGDIFWPPHYPASMNESPGMSTASTAATAAITANVRRAGAGAQVAQNHTVPSNVQTAASG